ncbi:MAG: aspartyl/asparaginyl beta-hydroxylase domain-containing protein [Alphaproteobacteria bacterium]
MDLGGKPLIDLGPIEIDALRAKLLLQPASFWAMDRENRVQAAGDRPGNAVFYFNDVPACANRNPIYEAQIGKLSVLRYPDRALFAEINELIETAIKPILPDCGVMRVHLAELPPGQVIKPHFDGNILAYTHRLHVPLVTHAGVKFIIDGKSFFLEVGRLYDLNNVLVHSVVNDSDVMRIHLLIDMLPRSVAKINYYDTEAAMKSALAA